MHLVRRPLVLRTIGTSHEKHSAGDANHLNIVFESTAAWTWLLNNWHKIRVALLTVKTSRCMIMNIHVNYFQRMVRNGFFIGKRILSAFPRYARLASHEQAVEKDTCFCRFAVSFVEGCARPISRQRTKEHASAHRSSRASPLRSFDQPVKEFLTL